MRAREFIIEYRQDITQRQYGDAIIRQMLIGPDSRKYMHDLSFREGPLETRNYKSPYDKDALLKDAFGYIEDGDPTYSWGEKTGGMYVPWIAREYAKGNIKRLEDCPSRVNAALQSYHRYKTKKDFKERFPDMVDIMRVDWEELEYVMNTYEPRLDLKDRGSSETIYDGEDARVIKPMDQAAACYYGQGTRWCTAATRGQNMFNHYNERGPLYIILPKNPEHQGEKYQLHPATDQYMDLGDNPVHLYELYTRYPKAVTAIAKADRIMQDMILFADPEIVVGIWNALADITVKAAINISKKPQFSTDLTDSARQKIESDIDMLSVAIMDKTHREILEEYKYSPVTTIPYLKGDIEYQIRTIDIDDEFKLHVLSYLNYRVDIVKTSDVDDTADNTPYDVNVYKTVGKWSIIIKPQSRSKRS